MTREELKQAVEAINKHYAETPKTELQIKLGEALQTLTEKQRKHAENELRKN